MVIDNAHSQSASRVATGIYNPITGRRMVKTWMKDILFPCLHDTYKALEQVLRVKIIYLYSEVLKKHNGGIEITQSGYVNTETLLQAYKQHLISRNCYLSAKVHREDIVLLPDNTLEYKDIMGEKLIWCNGHEESQNSYFSYLPFRCVKGETMDIKIRGEKLHHIINHNGNLLPTGNKQYKIGATYENQDLTATTTTKGRIQLTKKLEHLLKIPCEIIDQKSGIRPATADRKPFFGVHKNFKQMFIFNGLGFKGISLAPYFAKVFVAFLENNQPLPRAIDINRFEK